MQINSQIVINTRVMYRGYGFRIEATIKDSKRNRFGTDVLLQTDAGLLMWRSAGDCSAIECPAQYVWKAVS